MCSVLGTHSPLNRTNVGAMLSQGQTFSAEGLRKKSTTRARAHLAFNNDQQKRGSQTWQKVTLHWAFLSATLPTKPGHLQKRGNK